MAIKQSNLIFVERNIFKFFPQILTPLGVVSKSGPYYYFFGGFD